MNIDIKSVLIGVLFTIGILSVMAFDDHEKEIGRYAIVSHIDYSGLTIMDTTNGKLYDVRLKVGVERKQKMIDEWNNSIDRTPLKERN